MNGNNTLDARAVIKTLEILRNRIAERFPTRGITTTAIELVNMSRGSAREAASLGNTMWWLRLLSLLALAGGVYAFWLAASLITIRVEGGSGITLPDLTQGLEATFNILLICGLVVAFLWRLESRYKRIKALNGLYRLRAISHVIDMHQLTKDPAIMTGTAPTESSPVRDLTAAELIRYLDYCTEMLSLIGKLAALYAQYFPDATVIGAVNDIEELTSSLSRKVWQKIMLTQQTERAN